MKNKLVSNLQKEVLKEKRIRLRKEAEIQKLQSKSTKLEKVNKVLIKKKKVSPRALNNALAKNEEIAKIKDSTERKMTPKTNFLKGIYSWILSVDQQYRKRRKTNE